MICQTIHASNDLMIHSSIHPYPKICPMIHTMINPSNDPYIHLPYPSNYLAEPKLIHDLMDWLQRALQCRLQFEIHWTFLRCHKIAFWDGPCCQLEQETLRLVALQSLEGGKLQHLCVSMATHPGPWSQPGCAFSSVEPVSSEFSHTKASFASW